jgi:hypothetical protein
VCAERRHERVVLGLRLLDVVGLGEKHPLGVRAVDRLQLVAGAMDEHAAQTSDLGVDAYIECPDLRSAG